jgi:hypothetical protein
MASLLFMEYLTPMRGIWSSSAASAEKSLSLRDHVAWQSLMEAAFSFILRRSMPCCRSGKDASDCITQKIFELFHEYD